MLFQGRPHFLTRVFAPKTNTRVCGLTRLKNKHACLFSKQTCIRVPPYSTLIERDASHGSDGFRQVENYYYYLSFLFVCCIRGTVKRENDNLLLIYSRENKIEHYILSSQ